MRDILVQAQILHDHAYLHGPSLFQGAWTCLGIAVVMFLIHWRLTTAAIGALVVLTIVGGCFTRRISANDTEVKKREIALHQLSNASFKREADISVQVEKFCQKRDEI